MRPLCPWWFLPPFGKITFSQLLYNSVKVNISAEELLIDLACFMYEKKRMSMGQARNLSGLDQISFQKELAKRDIYIHYSEEDLRKDLKNLGISL
ncbi:MAG: UPF0175 family protein [Bacteroidia bacterium]